MRRETVAFDWVALPATELAALLPVIDNLSHAECAALLVHVAARLVSLTISARPQPAGKLVTAKQLAAELSLSLDTVYEMARTGRIPIAARKGRAIRFDPQAVRGALAS